MYKGREIVIQGGKDHWELSWRLSTIVHLLTSEGSHPSHVQSTLLPYKGP